MVFTDLIEVKTALGIDRDNTSQDAKLSLFITWACSWIEGYLNRPLFQRERTEYYAGTGTQKLLLKARPVMATPTPRVFVSERGLYGNTEDPFPSTSELTYGDGGLSLFVDREDGGSNCGILVRPIAAWPKPYVRQPGYLSPYLGEAFGNIKVIYTGGYTPDTLPDEIALAAVELVARMRGYFPLAMPVSSESYEERSISFAVRDQNFLMGQVKYRLSRYRNWRW